MARCAQLPVEPGGFEAKRQSDQAAIQTGAIWGAIMIWFMLNPT
jgi:hypothetical protein